MNTLFIRDRWGRGWEHVADGIADWRDMQAAEAAYHAANGNSGASCLRETKLRAPTGWVRAQAEAEVRRAAEM